MKIKTQIAMVLNLDKCIGCHTCSVTCKNVWTSRKGMEYAWWNNVETKPGPGYPKTWEDQKKYRGGWGRTKDGKTELCLGNRPKDVAALLQSLSASGERLLRAVYLRLLIAEKQAEAEDTTVGTTLLHDHGQADGQGERRSQLGG